MTTLTAPRKNAPSPVESDGFDATYERLVDARLDYEMLKSRGAPSGALIEARVALHRVRAEMATHRHLASVI